MSATFVALLLLPLRNFPAIPAVRHIAKGMGEFQNKSFRFPNFTRSSILLRIIEFWTFSSEFAQVSRLSFLAPLRAPSETLTPRSAFADDRIADHTHQPDKALIKLTTLGNRSYLVLKFSYRKNLVCGCIRRRPWFCSIGSTRAIAIFPVNSFWHRIKARVHSAHLLFPSITRRTLNRIVKRVIGKLAVPHAERYRSHALRRGTAQELKETCSPWVVVASAGRWRSASLLSDVDTSDDVETDMPNLWTNPILSESEDELA